MKTLLVAIYIAGLGAADRSQPVQINQYPMSSMSECKELAKVMVERTRVGKMRAFCEKVPA